MCYLWISMDIYGLSKDQPQHDHATAIHCYPLPSHRGWGSQCPNQPARAPNGTGLSAMSRGRQGHVLRPIGDMHSLWHGLWHVPWLFYVVLMVPNSTQLSLSFQMWKMALNQNCSALRKPGLLPLAEVFKRKSKTRDLSMHPSAWESHSCFPWS